MSEENCEVVRLRNQADLQNSQSFILLSLANILLSREKGTSSGAVARCNPGLAQDDDEQLLFERCIGKRRFEHVADRLPGTAIELNQSHLLDWSEILRTRVDLDTGQEPGGLIVPQ